MDNGQLILKSEMKKNVKNNSQLPEGWEVKKLGEVCEIFNGLWKGKKPPFIEIGVIRNTNFTKDGFLDDSNIAFLPVEVKQYEKRKLQYGDIILEKSGGGPKQPVGRVILFNKREGKYSFSNFTSVIRIKDNSQLDFTFLHKFLFWMYVSGITETMQRRSTGIRNLQLKEYKQIPIPIPPLSEQKRIVAILDRAFEAIDKAKANAEQNFKNAKELFESYLQGVFDNNNWKKEQIKYLTSLVTKGSSPNWQGVNYVDSGGIFFLTSKNVGEGELLLNNKKYLEEKFNDIQKTSRLKKGDVLTNIVGASIGRTAIFDLEEITNINQAVCLMRCNPEKIYNYYLMYLLNSPFFKNILHDNEVDNARANLSLTFFKNLSIPLPKLSEQKEIVENINSFSAETKKLEFVYQQKIANLEELKKSVLQKAFRGELTGKEISI